MSWSGVVDVGSLAGTTVRLRFVLKDADLYAMRFANPDNVQYSVSYNANGATSGTAPASQSKTHGVALTLATNSGNLAKTGYTFAGWNTAANGSGTDYAAGATYSIVVGAGGSGGSGTTDAARKGGNGGDSSAFGLTAFGGGGGYKSDGLGGGSGGGANASSTATRLGGSATQTSQDGATGYGSAGASATGNYQGGGDGLRPRICGGSGRPIGRRWPDRGRSRQESRHYHRYGARPRWQAARRRARGPMGGTGQGTGLGCRCEEVDAGLCGRRAGQGPTSHARSKGGATVTTSP
jgi:hypothetical protein